MSKLIFIQLTFFGMHCLNITCLHYLCSCPIVVVFVKNMVQVYGSNKLINLRMLPYESTLRTS